MLILDNFDHLLTGLHWVHEILQGCPQVKILVTSRQRLNLASEHRYELSGLAFPEVAAAENVPDYTAVQLFVKSGRRAQPTFTLTADNAHAVARICQLLQGMPLGVVLAAAWLPLLTPAEIAREMEASLAFLAADLQDLPPRQRSMHAVFEQSWQIMTPAERNVMAALSLFRGGYTREAAEQVAGANLRILLGLVNKSMVQRHESSGRFTLHELLRQFAKQKLEAAGQLEQALLAHCHYFAHLIAEETNRSIDFNPIQLPRKFAADWDNIQQAWNTSLQYGLAEKLRAMGRGMASIQFAQGMAPHRSFIEANRALERHQLPEDHPTRLFLRLLELITLRDATGVFHKDALSQTLETLSLQSDDMLLYWSFSSIGVTEQSDIEWSMHRLEKAYQIALKLKDEHLQRRVQALTLGYLIELGIQADSPIVQLANSSDQSRLNRLQEFVSELEPKYPQSFIVIYLHLSICTLYSIKGAHEQAIKFGTHALKICKEIQELYWISSAASQIATIYLEMGQLDQCARYVWDVIEWHLAIGKEWQTIGYLQFAAARFHQLIGGETTAVAILSMVYHHPESVHAYKSAINDVRPKFKAALGDAQFQAAWEAGRKLDFATAVTHLSTELAKHQPTAIVKQAREP